MNRKIGDVASYPMLLCGILPRGGLTPWGPLGTLWFGDQKKKERERKKNSSMVSW